MDEIIDEISVQEASNVLERLISERKAIIKAAGVVKHLASIKQATQEAESRLGELRGQVAKLEADHSTLWDEQVAQKDACDLYCKEQVDQATAKLSSVKEELVSIQQEIGEAKASRLQIMEQLQTEHDERMRFFRGTEMDIQGRIADLRKELQALKSQAASMAQ